MEGTFPDEDLERAIQSHLCNIRVALGRVSGRPDVRSEIERGLRAVVEAPGVTPYLALPEVQKRSEGAAR